MRRYTSVLMLGARGVVMPLIAVLLLMSAAEAGLFFRVRSDFATPWSIQYALLASHVVWAYRAALVLLAAACCVHVSGLGGAGSTTPCTVCASLSGRLRCCWAFATVLLLWCCGRPRRGS